MGILAALFGLISQAVGGITSLRSEQSNLIQGAMGSIASVITAADSSDAQKAQAHAMILAADSASSSWLARTWRPFIIYAVTIVVFAYLFGYVPKNMTPEIMSQFLNMMMTVVVGFGGFRTGEKIVENITRSVNIGKLLQTFVEKKL